MFRSTNRPESIGSRLLTSFSSANVIVPPYEALPAVEGAELPPPAGCWPPAQAARTSATAPASASAKRAERIGEYPLPTDGFRGGYVRPLAAVQCVLALDLAVAALSGFPTGCDPLATLPSEGRKKRPSLPNDFASFDMVMCDRSWTRPCRGGSRVRSRRHRRVRRGEDAAKPPREDRGEEPDECAEGERVRGAVGAQVTEAWHDVREAADAGRSEQAAVGRVAEKRDDEKHEEAKEGGHHPVPAGPVARHAAGDIAADQIGHEDPDHHGDRRGEVTPGEIDTREDSGDRRGDKCHSADGRDPPTEHRHPRGARGPDEDVSCHVSLLRDPSPLAALAASSGGRSAFGVQDRRQPVAGQAAKRALGALPRPSRASPRGRCAPTADRPVRSDRRWRSAGRSGDVVRNVR